MKHIIYVKYSNERNKQFAIKTNIVEDETGKRYVQKFPAFSVGKQHIEHIYEAYKALDVLYADTFIKMNVCEPIEDGVQFAYIEGDTLESRLDAWILEKDYQKVIDTLKLYAELIRKVSNADRFTYTQQFKTVFGDVVVPEGLRCAPVSNIDMIVANVLITGETWNIIDYEWTFAFPIPANFIIYRMLHYYLETSDKRTELKKKNLYFLCGISTKEVAAYEQMERNFQAYLVEGMTPIRELYTSISPGSYHIQDVMEIMKGRTSRMQVFFDRGGGFREADSFYYYPKMDEKGYVKYRFNIPKNTRAVRIDPMEVTGVIYITDLRGYVQEGQELIGEEEGYELSYLCNGDVLTAGLYFFKDNDAQIMIMNLKENTREIFIECSEMFLHGEFWNGFVRTTGNFAYLNHRLYEAEKKYHEIQGTIYWKITKPLRIFVKALKEMLYHNYTRYAYIMGMSHGRKFGAKAGKAYRKELLDRRFEHNISDKINAFVTEAEKERQRSKKFKQDIIFSVIVPLYNTPETYLREMIESVLSQTYRNLELCLADGSDHAHKYVKQICKKYRRYDKRVKYKKIEGNLGISGNTNVALSMAEGDYISLFDHDDFLHPSALYETMKVIERKGADYIYTDEIIFKDDTDFTRTLSGQVTYHYKPDFAPDSLRGVNYICHLSSFKKELLQHIGEFHKECDGSQDYDLILRLTEQAKNIVHIPKALYLWRSHEGSTAGSISNKMYALDAGKLALKEHLKRINLQGKIVDANTPSTYRISYDIIGNPRISIIIPNKDHVDDLDRCITSIEEMSTYRNFDIVVVENNSEDEATFVYYETLKSKKNVKIVTWEGSFNFAAINNFGVQHAEGEYVLLLNNDMKVITPEWLEEMLMYAQRTDVGCVGAMLYYEDDTIQHAGIIIGIGGSAGHSHKGFKRGDNGYLYKLSTVQNVSAVTGACVMIAKEKYAQVHGLDEKFAVAFNDVDFCLRVREAGYLNIFTPFAQLYHYESRSRGYEDTDEKKERFLKERDMLRKRHQRIILIEGDPYYNQNLTLDSEDFKTKI